MSSLESLLLPLLYVAGGYLLRHLGFLVPKSPAPTKTPAGPAQPAPSLASEAKSELVTLEQEALTAIQQQLAGVARDALAKALSGLTVPPAAPGK